MPQFTNTKRVDTLNNIAEHYKERLNSPYNILLNLKPYVLDYWNQDTENSTSDLASNLIYEPVGDDSPLKFNMIQDAVMYGLSQFQIDLEVGDFGLESSYSGESTVLPNTWIPYSGDFFTIKHSGSFRSFVVTSVTPDTLPNGANFYKIQFDYSTKLPEDLNKLTIERYRFILDNVGSNFSAVIQSSKYDDIRDLEVRLSTLKKYFTAIFFRDNVQTFVYRHNLYNFYDPYMIEFLRKNAILNDDRDVTYVAHGTPVQKTFALDYDRTFLRAIELRDKNISFFNNAVASVIENTLTLFYYRSEEYYEISYSHNLFATEISILEIDLLDRIKNNTRYQPSDQDRYKNIIIDYLNNNQVASMDIQALSEISFADNIHIFYNVPIIIYILERYIQELITNKPKLDISKQVTYK